MKKNITFFLLIFFALSCFNGYSQARIALTAGPQSAKVFEYNSIPGWNDDFRPFYKGRTGFHFGALLDIPLSHQNDWFFQPGVTYSAKGRQFNKTTYPSQPELQSVSTRQYVNYLELPLNVLYKAHLGNGINKERIRFIFGAGPYLSYLLGGKETADTTFTNGSKNQINNSLSYGSGPGEYSRFDLGINGLLGFEFGHFIISFNMSRGLLTSFYHANGYDAKFRNGVIGGSIGFLFGKSREVVVHDRDKDGIPDDVDECPDEPGTALTHGCPDKDGDGIPDKVDKCPDVPGTAKYNGCPVPDMDGDGVPDDVDKCPTVPGLPIYDGCPFPDRDHDGVSDLDDKCPDTPGPASNKGCPVGDRDKDGINDLEDKCPDIPGVAKYQGCPIPDTDGDGLNDEVDKCPKTKGPKENQGCPIMSKEITDKVAGVTKKIKFDDGRSDIPSATYKALDEMVKILKQYPSLTLQIESYTASNADSVTNQKIAVERANNIMAYIGLQGIDWSRLKAIGKGTEKTQKDHVELIAGYE